MRMEKLFAIIEILSVLRQDLAVYIYYCLGLIRELMGVDREVAYLRISEDGVLTVGVDLGKIPGGTQFQFDMPLEYGRWSYIDPGLLPWNCFFPFEMFDDDDRKVVGVLAINSSDQMSLLSLDVGRFFELAIRSKRERERTIRRSYIDGLTQLPNRRAFEDVLQELLKNSLKEKIFKLFIIDLNLFKQINDRLGHHVGDRILAAMKDIFGPHQIEPFKNGDFEGYQSSVILQMVSGGGLKVFIARIGGDEFAAIVSADYRSQINNWVESVIKGCETIEVHDEMGLKIPVTPTCVIGGVEISDGQTQFELMKSADYALYALKWYGSNLPKWFMNLSRFMKRMWRFFYNSSCMLRGYRPSGYAEVKHKHTDPKLLSDPEAFIDKSCL